MIVPDKPLNENERIEALRSYSLLDTLPEQDYDDITAIAAQICDTPIALISLVDTDRQWFKSHHGLSASETHRDIAFCAHTINTPNDILVVHDSRKDIRFVNNPLVNHEPHVIFYAGIPLNDKQSFPLGTLCVIDHKPRELTDAQLNALYALRNQVINLFELRRSSILFEKTIEQLKIKNNDLEQFATVGSHNLKTPLIGISGLTRLLEEKYAPHLDDPGKKMLKMIDEGTTDLITLIDGLMEFCRYDMITRNRKFPIRPEDLINELQGLFTHIDHLFITFESEVNEISVNKSALERILINLIDNSIRFNTHEEIKISLKFSENDENYIFEVADNGQGIDPEKSDRIFKIFEGQGKKDRFNRSCNGIGLATVKRIVENSGGQIYFTSQPGEGTIFTFTLAKEG